MWADTAAAYAGLPQPVKDRIEGLEAEHDIVRSFGRHVTDLIMRKLAKVLATKVRKEDTFSQIGDGQFAINGVRMMRETNSQGI